MYKLVNRIALRSHFSPVQFSSYLLIGCMLRFFCKPPARIIITETCHGMFRHLQVPRMIFQSLESPTLALTFPPACSHLSELSLTRPYFKFFIPIELALTALTEGCTRRGARLTRRKSCYAVVGLAGIRVSIFTWSYQLPVSKVGRVD